jgi:hypothetical protein
MFLTFRKRLIVLIKESGPKRSLDWVTAGYWHNIINVNEMSGVWSMDNSSIDTERFDPYTRVRQLAPIPNRRSDGWPFLFTSKEGGFYINQEAPRKKVKISEMTEAFL